MPVSLKQISDKTAETELKIGDDTLKIEYNPAKWTPEFESTLKVDEDTPFASVLYARMIATLVTKWDLVEDEETGKTVELSEERLVQLPSKFLIDVTGALTEHMSPKKKPSANSGSFS